MVNDIQRKRNHSIVKRMMPPNNESVGQLSEELGITEPTLYKWRKVIKKEEFVDLPPTKIVIKLADQCIYIASESSFCRVLSEYKMQNHRGRSRKPEHRLPESHLAVAPNQVWTWDITWVK